MPYAGGMSSQPELSPEAQQVLDRAKALSPEEQLRVSEQLHDAQAYERADGLHPEWDAELGRRLKSIEDGTAVLHDWQDVKKQLHDIAGG